MKQNGSALIFASSDLRNDRQVVLEAAVGPVVGIDMAPKWKMAWCELLTEFPQAVRQNGLALQHASDELQTDGELLKEARGQTTS